MLMQERKPAAPRESVEGPVRLTVTDDRITQLSGVKGEKGLLLKSFSPYTILRMIVSDSLKRIELPVARSAAQRGTIIDLSKAIANAMLFRQFDLHLFNRLLNIEAVRRWNRHNPRTPIDHKTSVSPDQARKVRVAQQEPVERARRETILAVGRAIDRHPDSRPDEKSGLLALCSDTIGFLSPNTWFALVICLASPSYAETVRTITELQLSYLKRFAVSDYVSMLIIELLVFLETGAASTKGGGERPAHPLELRWKVRERRAHAGDRARLQVTVTNIRDSRRELGSEIYGRSHLEVKEKSLMEFYNSSLHDGVPANLGFYYLSFLKNACAEVDILFDAFVSQLQGSAENIVNLVFLF